MQERDLHIQAVTQRLRIIFRAMQAHSKFVEKECGLSSAKLWMLHHIAANPGLKVSVLASSLFIHPSTCSNMLGRLEEKNLVVRDRQKKDQRSVLLYITEEGAQLLAKAPKPVQGKLSTALQSLSSQELLGLEEGLAKLIDALDGYDDMDSFFPIPTE
ncbi:MAG TPA: MarR family transcriptional regulator [Desulforhopalus sp.]|jgi:MarR family transcriptional regulator, organic hydroperoxide resistance regulator|nr:MarR family transcriptional regulator [Desulforhopalus sp.]